MTRRMAMTFLGAFTQASTTGALHVWQETAPARLHISMDQWSDWTVHYKGESVTFTSAELFAALKEKS